MSAGTLVGPVSAMTRDAGCELNLVPTLRHMIMANNCLTGLSGTRGRPGRFRRGRRHRHTGVMSSDARAVGVVLAAGAGSRYGQPKVLAADGYWLERAVAALDRGGCDEVIVVLGAAGADAVEIPVPGRFFLKSGNVARSASPATSHEATVSPPPPEDPPPPHPASAPLPSSAAPASPTPPSSKNRRRLMPPLTHLTFLVDKPDPFRSTARCARSPAAWGYSYRGPSELMC